MIQHVSRHLATAVVLLGLLPSAVAEEKKPASRSEAGGFVVQTYEIDNIPNTGTEFTAAFGRPFGDALVMTSVAGFEVSYKNVEKVRKQQVRAEVKGKDADKGTVTIACHCDLNDDDHPSVGKMTVVVTLIGTQGQVAKQELLEATKIKPDPNEDVEVLVLSMPSVHNGLLLKLEPGECMRFDGGVGKGLKSDGNIQFKVWDQSTGQEVAKYRAGGKLVEYRNTGKATKYLLVGGRTG